MSHEPHGFALNPEDERLLRGPVPDEALIWAAAAVGSGARVRAVEPLWGGTSSAVHALAVQDGGGSLHELVLRRFVRRDWLAEEPDLAEREATALRIVAGAAVPTPSLVAVDPDGALAGVPALVMSRLPGRIVWHPAEPERFLRALAEMLPAVHATPLPAGVALPDYRPYELKLSRAPAWATHPDIWLRAIEALTGSPPSDERVFIHRDFHPGNVLWEGDRLSGLVDWVNASAGSPWADVGHCRVNIASELGEDAADRFLDLYRTVAGRTDDYHPYWDISAAIGGLDESGDDAPSPADEEFLARAVYRL
ncbi:MAG TPA: aminoglycoside phosphotransferase family protein [Thermoleophilaceae bacterium]